MSAELEGLVGCSQCAAPATVVPGPDRYGPESWCAECRALLGARIEPEPVAAPLAASAPAVDLGRIHGLWFWLLAVELWPEHTMLEVAMGGEEGWIDREHLPRSRWSVEDAQGNVVWGAVGGYAASDEIGFGHVELPPLSPDDGPWTITVHRGGDRASVAVDRMRRRGSVRPQVLIDPPGADASPRCRWCMEVVVGTGSICDRCRRVLTEASEARERVAAPPRAEPLVLEVGATAAGGLAFLGVERWDGWFAVRYHVGGDWEARTGGLKGAWHAEDDWGTEVDGVELSTSGGSHGLTARVTFPGDLDPRATLVCLTLVNQGATVLEVDLPLTPFDGLA